MMNPYQPGSRVTPEVCERWGCDWPAVQARADELKADLELGQNWIPQVGQDACEVLARVGAPTDVDYQQTTMGRSASWWYQMQNTDAHLLSLDLDPETGDWFVSYVGW